MPNVNKILFSFHVVRIFTAHFMKKKKPLSQLIDFDLELKLFRIEILRLKLLAIRIVNMKFRIKTLLHFL